MITQAIAPGIRVQVRGEDFLIRKVEENYDSSPLIHAEGISELVKGQRFVFDGNLDDIHILDPINTKLQADKGGNYKKTKLFIETHLRNAQVSSSKIEIADKAAIDSAPYQFEPTFKALNLPKPRILIADAVGLGKTIEVGILLAELMKRGRGQRILVLALKSILTQFQQEIWNRFAIPLVRLDSQGIMRIQAQLPSNKNPFEFYDKVIVSIDSLKNNEKFLNHIQKTKWDVIVIDECHTVANAGSLRGGLAQILSQRCESFILTSATPHNGKKANFANLLRMIEPTAIPRHGDFDKSDIGQYYVRRFKKDVQHEVSGSFQDRQLEKLECQMYPEEEAFLALQQKIKFSAINNYKAKKGNAHDMLFSIGLFKSYFSSPEACLYSLDNRLKKLNDKEEGEITIEISQLEEARGLLQTIIKKGKDAKYDRFLEELKRLEWKGASGDDRILVFAERIETLNALASKLARDFKSLKKDNIQLFHGGFSDVEQQEIIDDFGRADSGIKVMLASNAASQGVNLHYFCNRMFNYDVSWSLIVLEQRNGRIDRYGQKRTPFIYYLLAQSDMEGLKTDLHIINNLIRKEEEVYKTLGDSGTILGLYNPKKEEQATTQAIIKGDTEFLEKEIKTEENDFFAAMFAEAEANAMEDEEEESTDDSSFDLAITSEHTDAEDAFKETISFFKSDFDYYEHLIGFLKNAKSIKEKDVQIEENIISVFRNDEMKLFLSQLPPEAHPKDEKFYQLCTDKDLVQKSIDKARKKQKEWAEFQILYDLHPIVRVWMNKLHAEVEKDVALVAKTSLVPQNTRWYVFHGQNSNNLGQAVLSEFFVVGLKSDGSLFLETPIPFVDFVQQYQLRDTLYEQAMPEEELISLKEDLADAISYARIFYMLPLQGKLAVKMENQSTAYLAKLNDWYNTSKEQLQLKFEHTGESLHLQNKNRQEVEIKTILDKESQYFKDLTSLDNEAYLQLLAVFYHQ